MVETNRSQRTVPVLTNQVSPITNSVTVRKLLLPHQQLVTHSQHYVAGHRPVHPHPQLGLGLREGLGTDRRETVTGVRHLGHGVEVRGEVEVGVLGSEGKGVYLALCARAGCG
jgi:hypothetical protein